MDDERLSAANPLRPPSWRHQLAEQLLCEGRFRSRGRYDAATLEIARYLRLRRQKSIHAPSSSIIAAPLCDAYRLRESGPASQLSAAIEAACLADATQEAIAADIGVSVECIAWYEAAFFDVRDRLHARGFIIQDVIERDRSTESRQWPQYGWKIMGYLGGRDMLDETMGSGKIQDQNQYLAALRQRTQLMIGEELHRMIKELDDPTPAALAALARCLGGGRTKTSEDHVPTSYERNIQAMLECLKFEPGPFADDDPRREVFERGAAELTHSESMRILCGESMPHLDALRNLGFPGEPRSEK